MTLRGGVRPPRRVALELVFSGRRRCSRALEDLEFHDTDSIGVVRLQDGSNLGLRDRQIDRPFKIPLFPLPAIAFCATCVYLLRASVQYARWLSLIGIVPTALGIVVWLALRSRRTA